MFVGLGEEAGHWCRSGKAAWADSAPRVRSEYGSRELA